MTQNELPEAPVSINTNLKSESGFEYQLTLRGTSYTSLLENLKDIESKFADHGLTPQPRYVRGGGFKKELEYVPDRKCPTCGNQLIYATKRDGTKFIKCSTNKWINGQATGCSFVEWSEKLPLTTPIPEKQVSEEDYGDF